MTIRVEHFGFPLYFLDPLEMKPADQRDIRISTPKTTAFDGPEVPSVLLFAEHRLHRYAGPREASGVPIGGGCAMERQEKKSPWFDKLGFLSSGIGIEPDHPLLSTSKLWVFFGWWKPAVRQLGRGATRSARTW